MKASQFSLVSLAGLLLIGCATQQSPSSSSVSAPPTTAKTAAAKPAPVSEFQQVIDLLQLKGPALATYQTAWDAREKAVADFAASAEGRQLAALRQQIAAAKAAKDEAQAKKLQVQAAPLVQKEWELRRTQRAAVFATLTLAQQQQWAAHLLNRWAVPRAVRGVKYTQPQLAQIQALCNQAAANFVKADTLRQDPYLTNLRQLHPALSQQITDKVLTAEQKAALNPATPKLVPATTAK